MERQVDQMVRFIKQEAEEKANEISVSAEEVSTHMFSFACKVRHWKALMGIVCESDGIHVHRLSMRMRPAHHTVAAIRVLAVFYKRYLLGGWAGDLLCEEYAVNEIRP